MLPVLRVAYVAYVEVKKYAVKVHLPSLGYYHYHVPAHVYISVYYI